MLVALDFFLHSPKEIVISGDPFQDKTSELLKVIRDSFVPNSVVVQASIALEKDVPLVEGRIASPREEPRVFVCTNNTCRLPSKTPQELEFALKN